MSRFGGDPVKSPCRELYTVPGRVLGGSGVASIKDGKGFSLTYVTTGTYKIVPDINYPRLAGGCAVVANTSAALAAKVSTYTVGGATPSITFVVFTTTSGSAVDLGAAEELWFVLEYDRTVTP